MDAYRILGVQPTADEAVIRAAYLALMKRYHPDQPGADVERAKEIAAAYRLLGEPARRAGHDRQLAGERMMILGAPAAMPPPRSRQTGRTSFFALSLVAAGLLALVVSRPPSLPAPDLQPELALAPPPATERPAPVKEPEERAEPLSPTEARVEKSPEPDRVIPRPTREPTEAAEPTVKEPTRVVRASAPAVQPAPKPRLSESAAIDLKALERHQLILYNQSFLAGTERKRALLLESRTPFMKRLEECGSDPCRRDVYLSRNQEIARIMGL